MALPLSALEKARISDEVEALAFRAMYAAAPRGLSDRLGLRVTEVAGATLLLAPGLPTPMFNRAIGLGLREEATSEGVEAIATEFRSAGVGDWWLHWNPHASPAGFAQRIETLGFTLPQRRSWAKLLRPPEPAPAIETTLEVRLAQDAEVQRVAQLATQAFEMPPFMADWLARLHGDAWRTYAVLDDGEIVGGGSLFLGGQAGWLGVAAIAPTHRGRNGQAALIARRIADTGAAGAIHVVSETGEPTAAGEANPSLANLRRCGFETVASRLNYKLAGTPAG